MATIELGGVNLDVTGIVSQLMQVESAPLTKLQKEASDYNSRISELGRLKSAMSDLQTSMGNLNSLSKFEQYAVTTSQTEGNESFSVTTDEQASAGIFDVEVLNLARSNKYGTSTGFPDLNSKTFAQLNIDNGTNYDGDLNISDGTNNFDININDKTLFGVRDAINEAAASGNVGVSASIVAESENSFHLVLTATQTGEANKIQLTGEGYTQLGLNETQIALDASVKIDGLYELSSPTNTITDAISGVDLNLLKPSPKDDNGDFIPSELKITRDNAAVANSIQEFVNSYNSLQSSIKIWETGSLKGDSVLRSIKNSMRGVLNSSSETGTFNYLSEIGVTSDSKTGALSLNKTTLDKAIAADYEAVSKLFATEDKGVAYRMEAVMEEYTKYDGLIKSKEDSLRSQVRRNGNEQERVEARLSLKEAAYKKQFSALDGLIGQMSSTSQALTGQLANLPGFV
ncbi:MAG: flagellar filament capping protein FliD [Gammaproteobacteria bacterium]|nr:flagellar filament capping protein FliD [Gammaproteobacteria bacterium]